LCLLLLLACCRPQEGFWRKRNPAVNDTLRTKNKITMPPYSAVKHEHPRYDCQPTHTPADKNPNLLEESRKTHTPLTVPECLSS